ncbi:terpene cyclase/mutase family protein [Peribacillus kribbensis]|uniref:terpene cyclase/mutase family protein n=1 Tax=Peribacillus kribbensis TaxID=356658 RepID=UPI000406D1B5|nr:prenyltransferase/squalene oxidase repeat-containing protein [Peribacillus kribbensis]
MKVNEIVQNKINKLIQQIREHQLADGKWEYCFESGPMTDAYFILMLRSLGVEEEILVQKLSQRLKNIQHSNGSWCVFEDDGGNLSATIEAYAALLYSGYATAEDENMRKAEEFILEEGGLGCAHPSTKFMLALNNLYPWPSSFPLPLLLLNIPSFLPFSFYKLSSYVRVHLAPILILGYKRFSLTHKDTPDLTHLYKERKGGRVQNVLSFFRRFIPLSRLNGSALKKAENYILDNIEGDGTLFSYASATFYMVYALLALGYDRNSPYIQHAIWGLKSMVYDKSGLTHLQNSPSTIWDTALLSYALQEAGVTPKESVVLSSVNFLQSHQQISGGWGFSESNSIHPDIDDTQASLRAIARSAYQDVQICKTWRDGVNWLLAMQNKDGGWGSFERNRHKSLLRLSPIENFNDVAIDPSTTDLTGRALEFLGNFVNVTLNNPRIASASNWLIRSQEENGSWFGRWGVSYIYGTWAAITGLTAVGVKADHPSIIRAVDWLKSIQLSDGGWGESCKSDKEKKYTPLPYSTIVQTSWAVDALVSACDSLTPEIERGIWFLTSCKADKSLSYQTGAGLPGHFYINYHSYRHIWPLVALAHYNTKFKK